MHAKKTNKTKVLAVVLALVLVIGCAAGATLAWLKVETTPVVNTFTYGDINIDLKEHKLQADGTLGTELVTENKDYKMVPGITLPKDPFVTVEPDSEACWLFVKIEAENGAALKTVDDTYPAGTYLVYEVATGWTPLAGYAGVYYIKVDADTAKAGITNDVLADNQVKVLETVTKDMMKAIKDGAPAPKLTFTAYAIQLANAEGEFAVVDAWKEIGA